MPINDYKGLSKKEVLNNRKKYGSNKITIDKKDSFLKMFILALGDPIIKILLIALLVKTIFLFKDFDWFETIGILVAIFLASFISTISEYGSEKAFLKLQEDSSKIKCKVIREGIISEILIDDVVTGDLIVLEQGDKIPSDGTIILGEIAVDESSLTGESKEVYKDKINNKVYRGCVVYQNHAIMRTDSVGINTTYGKIFSKMQQKKPDSPLKIRLRSLAKLISRIGYFGAILGSLSYLFSVIFIENNFNMALIGENLTNISYISHHLMHALTLSITIIIVAVPEGLPMMITLVLSSNMKRMIKNNVLVRKMTGIETAGSLNMLFFDKTGTITKGKPTVKKLILSSKETITDIEQLTNSKLFSLVQTSLISNCESYLDKDNNVIGGNITDQSILNFSKKIYKEYHIIKTTPFNSKNKYSKVLINYQNKNLTLIKGAHENLLKKCNYYYDKNQEKRVFIDKDKVNKEITSYVKAGSRVIFYATSNDYDDLNNLTYLGYLIIEDEIRSDAKDVIKNIKEAGVKVTMITGDNKDAAISIAKEVNLIDKESDIALDSEELNNLSDDEIRKILPNLKVVARALPMDKSRLVDIAKSLNFVVGMTGDGVNDALALKRSDVAFAMGSGTEVCKEASDIVILDDNMKSIVQAILYGRTIFKSIRKFIIFQLSVNICAVLISIIAPLLGINTPVTVIQMLWINMIMDTLAGFAFSYEAPLKEYLQEPPKLKNEKIMNSYMLNEIITSSVYSSIICLLFLKLDFFKHFFRYSDNNIYLMTAFFGLFIFIGIFNSFNARTHRINILAHIIENKVFLLTFLFIIIVQIILIYFGGDLFRTYGLTVKELEVMLLLAFSIIPIDFLRKIYLKLIGKKIGV